MLGMSSTAVRDRLTLLEGAPSVVETSSRHAGYYRAEGGESGLVQDDTLMVMDRLREVTQKALQLEVRYPICTLLILYILIVLPLLLCCYHYNQSLLLYLLHYY